MSTRVQLIGDNSVDSGSIVNATIKTEDILDGNITTAKIADSSVTTAKIADSSVTTAKIADSSVTAAKLESGAAVPVGAVFHFAAATPPTGYLKANGDTIPNGTGTVQGVTANFAPLYAILGSTYGGAGKLPDLRGEFLRGWDDARNVDSGRVFGGFQADIFKRHRHYHYQERLAAFPPNESPRYYWTEGPDYINPGFSILGYTGYEGEATDTETRPRNIALLACIKY